MFYYGAGSLSGQPEKVGFKSGQLQVLTIVRVTSLL